MAKESMQELINTLNEAAKVYYSESGNIISDKEYDTLYDKLLNMEKETGIVLPDSPTTRVGYKIVSSLNKVRHEIPALSLNKTKETDELIRWMGEKECSISWKMDGLTAVATYENGTLQALITRGNGEVGEDVTHNAPYIKGLPINIPYTNKLIVRGEVVISYHNFEQINTTLTTNEEMAYANPRNLASGSLRLLNTAKAAKRHLEFMAFTLVNPYIQMNNQIPETTEECLNWLTKQGFQVVEHQSVTKETVNQTIHTFSEKITAFPYPVDGLVLTYDKIDPTIGTTGKYPKYAMAFKWQDDTVPTVLHDIEWSASKTGLINPVAVFTPVEIEGTTVSRASVHNISILNKLKLHKGDTVSVYKANMIIPQIYENLSATDESCDPDLIPAVCPVCGSKTERKIGKNNSEFLYCPNENCPAKHLGLFERMTNKDALDITGLSEATLEKLINQGCIKTTKDIFHLDRYENIIKNMEGFGEKSYNNLITNIEKSRNTTFRKMFYALGIPSAGKDVAKILNNHFENREDLAGLQKSAILPDFIINELVDRQEELDGIGDILTDILLTWFSDRSNINNYLQFIQELNIIDDEIPLPTTNNLPLKGITFVVTGKVYHYANRNELKAEIEQLGGKVAGSVSKNTSFLINNDNTSTSSKNKKAQQLGIEIITEDEYRKRFL